MVYCCWDHGFFGNLIKSHTCITKMRAINNNFTNKDVLNWLGMEWLLAGGGYDQEGGYDQCGSSVSVMGS
jgi:hypothetical protein